LQTSYNFKTKEDYFKKNAIYKDPFNNYIDKKFKIIFIPLTTFDKNNQAHSSSYQYTICLINLFATMDALPSNSEFIFNLPIIGSNFSYSRGIKKSNEKESLDLIKAYLINYSFTSILNINIIKYDAKYN